MLILGDSHASTPDRRDALLSAYAAADGETALHVGDLEHYDLPRSTWFVAGNNEDFDVIEGLRSGSQPDGVNNAHLLASDQATVEGLRVGGLSGNFAPTRFESSRDELAGDRRRHFTASDIEEAARLEPVDVFLTHEAPTGLFWFGYDPGCEHVTDLLRTVDPSLCLVGHFHRHRASEVEGVRTVALAPTWEQYYTLDPETLELTAHQIPVEGASPE